MKLNSKFAITLLTLVPYIAFSQDSTEEDLAGTWQYEVRPLKMPDASSAEFTEALAERGLASKSAFLLERSDDGEYQLVTKSETLSGMVSPSSSSGDFVATMLVRDQAGAIKQFQLDGERVKSGLYKATFREDLAPSPNNDGITSHFTLTMKKIDSVYVCSNHDPIHSAVTLSEMRELTDSQECEGWHRLKGTNRSKSPGH